MRRFGLWFRLETAEVLEDGALRRAFRHTGRGRWELRLGRFFVPLSRWRPWL